MAAKVAKADPDAPIGSSEAAKYLSEKLKMRMPLRSVLYHTAKGHLPALRLGQKYLFFPRELDAWLATRHHRPDPPKAA